MSNELVYQLGLELIPGIGQKGVKLLISYCGSATDVVTASKKRLLQIPGIGEKMAKAIKSASTFKEEEIVINRARQNGINTIAYTDSSYPRKLRQIHDAPNIIYIKGKGDLNPRRSIAIVGARKATEYGKSITKKIISDLSMINVTVISGLAYGIDIQAHKSALKNGISTFAVIAGGHDRIYPSVHKKYAEEMLENGGIISESILGTKPDAHLFPKRNRIIAGLTDATIVVEAAERGGALITAQLANSYDRLVFAVPGDVGNTFSEGANKLIASQKALIYTGVEDLIYHLDWKISQSNEQAELPELSEKEEVVYTLLHESRNPLEIDVIAFMSQIPINQVASVLLELEFKDLVKSLPGKKYGLI